QAGPGVEPALRGPTASLPPATDAIEPPPAPMLATSTEGTRMSAPPKVTSLVMRGDPSTTTPTSKLVPPTSIVSTLRRPRRVPAMPPATTPEAGPDKGVETGWLASAAAVAAPPPLVV